MPCGSIGRELTRLNVAIGSSFGTGVAIART